MAPREALRSLADRVGILPTYDDWQGRKREVSDETREALLQVMGYEAASEEAARATLERLERLEAERLFPPTVVLPEKGDRRRRIALRVPSGTAGIAQWRAELRTEDGQDLVAHGTARLSASASAINISLPEDIAPGYHALQVEVTTPSGERAGRCRLIVTPATCWTVEEAIGDDRVFGLWANLYTVRSDRNWGVGDVGDLRELARWGAAEGADFIGLNPLHALRNHGLDVSPYSPVSRLFRNVIYLDVPAIPEFAESDDVRAYVDTPEFLAELHALRSTGRVEYGRILWLKRPVLERLHGTFIARYRGTDSPRGRAYAEYCARQGAALDDFATFMALEEFFWRQGQPTYWSLWPEQYRDPHSEAVAAFRREQADWVDLHRWMQFELDRQLGQAEDEARAAGMRIGLYQDLAVGTSLGGSDVWSFPKLFHDGATVGAPPDEYSATGQDWGLPPLDPQRLADDGFRYWIHLLRAAFDNAGALRIDHAMGMQRLFWIPAGRAATDGAYVRYPQDEMLGILALESRRHRAIVVAEDLGTVPKGFAAVLARYGILSSRVLYFERNNKGEFRASKDYSPRALVTTTTHDHAPLAAFWNGHDLALRRDLGLADDGEYEQSRTRRADERKALLARLQAQKLLPKGAAEPDYAELLVLVHRFLGRTPAPLVGISLDDITAETEPVNIPGVGPDRYPSWTRRMRMPLEQLRHHGGVGAAMEAAREERTPAGR